VENFTNSVTGKAITCSPQTLTGLNQSELYYVYYVDLTFAGGTVTPIATQNISDFENKAGYFLIGSIVTPSYTPRYQPSTYSDVGNQSTVNPQATYDNDVNTDAVVSGQATYLVIPGHPSRTTINWGDCIWSGFPHVTTTAASTLYIIAGANVEIDPGGTGGSTVSAHITAIIAGTTTTVASFSATTAETTYTVAVPSGTDLSTISVEAYARVGVATSTPDIAVNTVQITGFELYCQ
jgi:hypothetical protein